MTKCVLIVDEALAPGYAANVAAVMAMTLGTKVPEMIGDDFADASGTAHPGLYREGLPVLKAAKERLTTLRAEAVDAEVGVVGMPINGHQTNDYDEFIAMLRETEQPAYLGLALYGPKSAIKRLTGSLPLLR
jgi:hypothetical protein